MHRNLRFFFLRFLRLSVRVSFLQPSFLGHMFLNIQSVLVVVDLLLTSSFRFGRFTAFETSLRDIDGLLQNWDRTTGTVARADTPKSENFDDILPAPGSTRRTRDKKDKEKELREREKEREKEKAKEVGGLSQFEPRLTFQVSRVTFS